MIIKHLELKTYTFNDIEVMVEINYDKEVISVMERGSVQGLPTITKKNYVFANRGLVYVAGWKEILHAIEYAIDTASNELKTYIAEVQKNNEDSVTEVLGLATEMIKGKNKMVVKNRRKI